MDSRFRIKQIVSKIALYTLQTYKRTLVFGCLGLLASIIVATADFIRHLYISTSLVFSLAGTLGIILFFDFRGGKRFIKAAYVLSFNVFTTIIVFAEGLAPAGYLFFLVFLVALAFLMDDNGKRDPKILFYLIITTLSFCICIIGCPQDGLYQQIPQQLKHEMFVFNSIAVIILISVFTYIGISLENKIRKALMLEKNKAQIQSSQINEQNKQLKEIAFMSTHSIRMPVTNILSLTKMLEKKGSDPEKEKLIRDYLKKSAEELDIVVHEIIKMTSVIDTKDINT